MFKRRQQFKVDASVGLEITAAAIRAVEIKTQGQQAIVQRVAQGEMPEGSVHRGRIVDPMAVAGALRQLWEQGGFTTRRCVLALPAETLTPQQLTLPPAPPNEQRQIVRGELERFASIQEATPFGWMPLAPGGGAGGNTLAFLSEGEVIAGYRQALSMAGLDMGVSEPDSIAALRATHLRQLPDDAAAVVYVSDTCSEIAFLEAGRLRYYRRLDLGIMELPGLAADRLPPVDAEPIDPALARFLAGSIPQGDDKDLEPLALEIKRSLQYYGRAYNGSPQPQKIILLGDHPLLDRLAPILRSELRMEAEFATPLSDYPQSAGLVDAEGGASVAGYTVAVGAALRPLANALNGFVLDLKTPDQAQPLARHAPRYLMAALSGSTVITLVALGASMLLDARLSQARSTLNAANAELQAVTAQRAQALARVQQARLETSRLRKQALPVPRILSSLGVLMPEATSLCNFDLRDDGSMSLEGDARTPQQVNALIQQLSYDARFRAPLLESLDAGAERGSVHFRVQTGLVGYEKTGKKQTSG
jgi:type IV pilus assembly protein PilM